MPITAKLKGDIFDRFEIGHVEVKMLKPGKRTDKGSGSVSGIWDRLKSSVRKQVAENGKEISRTMKGAAIVASDSAKQAIETRNKELNGKAVNIIYEMKIPSGTTSSTTLVTNVLKTN